MDRVMGGPVARRCSRTPRSSSDLSVKVLFKLPLRQAAGMVATLLKLAGLDWPVPDYSTLCRRQKTVTVQIPYRRVTSVNEVSYQRAYDTTFSIQG